MKSPPPQPPDSITDQEAQAFLRDGFLVLRGVIRDTELAVLRRAMDGLLAYGLEQVRDHPDYAYGRGHLTGRPILHRVEYVIDKTEEAKVLLGHPYILRSVEKLQGKDFIPTWDSLVIKLPGEGMQVPWHRDAGMECVGDAPIFNVDFYLDEADLDTCVWVFPGSQGWTEERVSEITSREGFSTEGATPVPMHPGDVLLHNILLVHGSPPNTSHKLRRVIYYEFRPAHVELARGPHTPAYIPLKQKVLQSCIERRLASSLASAENPYHYSPPPPFEVHRTQGEELVTYRYPHEEFWRR
ncbi:MAG: phytanoyl-CoA dioxygenase family protein [Candidatus Omnitrophica bacterium]|nr:phytanoyl-CoA dioxygenase family protein [Candidatus Omnitrophota bacterium]